MISSTAEISTGIICVCLPTLAVFTHRRSRGPSTSIVNGECHMHRAMSSPRKQNLGLKDHGLFDGEYLELGPASSRQFDLKIIPDGVATGNRGEHTSPVVQGGSRSALGVIPIGTEEMLDESTLGMKIVKTVRLEQSLT